MMNDRFNEMYLKIVKAKGYDTKGNANMALKIYLEVIENYKPSDDFVYKRTCEILAKNGDFSKAKSYAIKALKLIRDEEIAGSSKYFDDLIKKIEEKEKFANKKKKTQNKEKKKSKFSLNIFESKASLIFLVLVFLFIIVISLPDKVFKMMFLSFAILAFILLIEIIIDLLKHLSVKVKGCLFLIFLCLSIVGLHNMPPSNWDEFVSIPSAKQVQNADKKPAKASSKKKDTTKKAKLDNKQNAEGKNQKADLIGNQSSEIKENDLEMLKDFSEQELNLNTYKITIKEDKILLDIQLKAGASEEEGKSIAKNILANLNSIKNFSNNEGEELGKLYDNYVVNVKIRNHTKELIARGKKSKQGKSIKW